MTSCSTRLRPRPRRSEAWSTQPRPSSASSRDSKTQWPPKKKPSPTKWPTTSGLTRALLACIGKLEDENVERQAQLEVFFKFEQQHDALKARHEAQTAQHKTLLSDNLRLKQEARDASTELQKLRATVDALEKRVTNEQTGRALLEERQEHGVALEQERAETIRQLERQLLAQSDEM